MKRLRIRNVVANLLVFATTALGSAWLFHQHIELRDSEVQPVKFQKKTQRQSWSRFQRLGPLPASQFSAQLQFINDNEGWCADFDDLYHTTDGGETWQIIHSDGGIRSFHFINSQFGWMNNGELNRTADGGHTWTTIVTPMSGITGSLWSFYLQDDGKVGWIAGGIFYTRDEPSDCFNNASGYLPGGTPACLSGTIFRTDDGGRSWRQQPTSKYIGRFMSISFVDEKHGWAAGDADVIHTTDGGNTWSNVNRFKKGCTDYYELPDYQPAGITFMDRKNGLLMFDFGLVAKSTDGGNTWCGIADLPSSASAEQCTTELPGKFRDIAFKDANHGIGLDCVGVLFETRDGGASWQKVETGMSFHRILLTDKTNAWLVTQNADLITMKL